MAPIFIAAHEDVRRLHIPVSDADPVHEVEASEQVPHEASRLRLLQRLAPGRNVAEQVGPLQKLELQHHVVSRLEEAAQPEERRRHQPCFPHVRGESGLDRDLPRQRVRSLMTHPHSGQKLRLVHNLKGAVVLFPVELPPRGVSPAVPPPLVGRARVRQRAVRASRPLGEGPVAIAATPVLRARPRGGVAQNPLRCGRPQSSRVPPRRPDGGVPPPSEDVRVNAVVEIVQVARGQPRGPYERGDPPVPLVPR
mmetsp:Transcript_60398/g.178891  ORF Transcript_60398/g.178891 Transcript_60398/m.178891 type:complete len:252 (-) Transcript_60398:1533-2288(-)